jgi:hypothetical protein
MKHEDLIIGGDLNFSLGVAELWDQWAQPNSLLDYFSHKLSELGLIDITPIRAIPNWRNNRMGEGYIAKIIDHFLTEEKLLEYPLSF